MHELAIAQHLVRLVEEHALSAGAEGVTRVHLSLGEGSHIVTESLATYFEMLTSDGGPARSASLVVKRVPMQFFCEACGLKYPVNHDYRCPTCQRTGRLSDPGDGLLLESLEVI